MVGRENMLPRHIAIIPDGNRRWAKKNRKTVPYAYNRGIEHIADVLKWCRKHRRLGGKRIYRARFENFAIRERKGYGAPSLSFFHCCSLGIGICQ